MGKIPGRAGLKGIIKELKPYEREKYKEYFSGAEVGSKSIKSLARDLGTEQGMMKKRKFLAAKQGYYEKKYPVLSEEKKRGNVASSRESEILEYRKEKGGVSIKDRKDRGEEAHRRAHEKRFAGSADDLGDIGSVMREKEGGARFAVDTGGEKKMSISDASNKAAPDKKSVPPSINKPPINPLGK